MRDLLIGLYEKPLASRGLWNSAWAEDGGPNGSTPWPLLETVLGAVGRRVGAASQLRQVVKTAVYLSCVEVADALGRLFQNPDDTAQLGT